MIDRSLVDNVELLSLDAGNTVIFLDHERIGRLVAMDARALIAAEGEAKHMQEDGRLVQVDWPHRKAPGAEGWGGMIGTMLVVAGLPKEKLGETLEMLWAEHAELNLYSLVPPGLGEALEAARAKGVRVAIVSNSEGMLETLFHRLGILKHFDTVVDSSKVGVSKPDPRIFEIAMERCAATPARTLHLGDSYATDTVGALAAHVRTALIDPFDHWKGRHLEIARVPGATEVAKALAS